MAPERAVPWWRQLATAAGSRVLTLPVTAAAAMLTARITIEATGAAVYGYIALIGQLFMLFTFADLGIGAAMSRAVARARASDHERALAVATVWRGYRALTVVSLAGVAIAVIVAATVGWDALLGVPEVHAVGANAATAGALGLFFAAVPLAAAQRILVGQGRSTALVLLGVMPPLGALAFTAALYAAGVTGFAFALGPAVGGVLFNGACLLLARREPVTREGLARLLQGGRGGDGLPVARIAGAAGAMLILMAANAVAVHGVRIVLSHTGSDVALAEFALVFQLYLPLWSVIYLSSTVLWSRFAIDRPSRATALKVNGALAGLAVGAGAGLLILGPPLVRFMSDGQVAPSMSTLAAFAGLLAIQGLNATQAMWFTDVAGLRFQAAWAGGAASAALILAAVIGPSLGAAGAALAAVVALGALQTVPGWMRAARLAAGPESDGSDNS